MMRMDDEDDIRQFELKIGHGIRLYFFEENGSALFVVTFPVPISNFHFSSLHA